MNGILGRAVRASLVMFIAAAAAAALAPRYKLSEIEGELDLNAAIPMRFAEWKLENDGVSPKVVNPQQQETLKRLYKQLLSRTYVNARGEQIMLSIAYGDDQRDGLTVHYPEVCYPAQGFQVLAIMDGSLSTVKGSVPVRRLTTVLGERRFEPVTYWTMVGRHASLGGVDKKIAEMKYSLKQEIPDGLLFRVSSINRDSEQAFQLQSRFIADLLISVDGPSLVRLSGLN